MNFVHAKGAIIPARIKEAFKVIGYFSYADGEVLCDGDACVISDTEEHMQIYIKKISNDGARDIIKKTRFGEIMEGLRKGASYAFDRGAYSRFFDLAKKNDIRLSFHPGQYTVLASDNPSVVERSIEDVEYHAMCAKSLGYGETFQDFKINIHMNGKKGFAGFKNTFLKLSPEARLMLTVENDEISCSVDDVLQAKSLCPIVLDIHHHWVKENKFIQPDDDRIKLIRESWRGVKPVLHYSISQEGLIPEYGFPDQDTLSLPKSTLRAHSNYYFNDTLNDWALSFDDFDIMCEVKMKNLAREKLYQYAILIKKLPA